MVKREAERYGVAIVGSEIVGLIPKRAIELTADFYLQLENFSPAQVFENRLEESLRRAAQTGSSSLARPFLEAVATTHGHAGRRFGSSVSGRAGASLGQMVAGLSRKKKSRARITKIGWMKRR